MGLIQFFCLDVEVLVPDYVVVEEDDRMIRVCIMLQSNFPTQKEVIISLSIKQDNGSASSKILLVRKINV